MSLLSSPQAQPPNLFEKYFLEIKPNTSSFSINTTTPSTNSTSTSNNNILTSSHTNNSFITCFNYFVIPYLSLSDLISLKQTSHTFNSLITSKSFKICVLSNSISQFKSINQRYSIWNHYLNLNSFIKDLISENISKENKDTIKTNEDFYNYMLQLVTKTKSTNENTPQNKSIIKSYEDIVKDIDRSFQTERFIKGNGKIELHHVLDTLATLKQSMGYCQGMNFIAGAFIHLLDKEDKTFYVFASLIFEYELNTLFKYGTPDYGMRIYQLQHYTKVFFPNLYRWFKSNQIPFDLIFSKWIMTLFSGYFDIEQMDFAFTCFIIDKWKGFVKLSLILLEDLLPELITSDLEKVSMLIQNKASYIKYHSHSHMRKWLYKYINKYKSITNKQIEELREEYFITLAKEKLNKIPPNEWDNDQQQALTLYINETSKINTYVKKDILNYRKLVENIEHKHLSTLKVYNDKLKIVKHIKMKLDKLAQNKFEYEEVFNMYKLKLKSMDDLDNVYLLKGDKQSKLKETENEKKRYLIQNELNKIMEKYAPLIEAYEKESRSLLKMYEDIDKVKYTLEKYGINKLNRKKQMEQFILFNQQKATMLIKELCDKLKLSEQFKKNNTF